VYVLLARRVQHVLECRDIRARTEVGTLSLDGDDADWCFAQREKRFRKLVGGNSVEGVLLFGTRQRYPADRALDRHTNILHREGRIARHSDRRRTFTAPRGARAVLRRRRVPRASCGATPLNTLYPGRRS